MNISFFDSFIHEKFNYIILFLIKISLNLCPQPGLLLQVVSTYIQIWQGPASTATAVV